MVEIKIKNFVEFNSLISISSLIVKALESDRYLRIVIQLEVRFLSTKIVFEIKLN